MSRFESWLTDSGIGVSVRQFPAGTRTAADAELARSVSGYSIGGVPPFGHAADLPVFMDRDRLGHQVVWAAAGRPDSVFEIDPDRLRELSQATVADLKVVTGDGPLNLPTRAPKAEPDLPTSGEVPK